MKNFYYLVLHYNNGMVTLKSLEGTSTSVYG